MRLPAENISYVLSLLLIGTSLATLFVAPEAEERNVTVKVLYLIVAGVLSLMYMINSKFIGKVPVRPLQFMDILGFSIFFITYIVELIMNFT